MDNSDYGTTIKDTPYYPLREGYGFTGWYKEPECINKWDFENNTLPTVEYDEEGNPTEYIETKLYAGWQKV
ncbi:MAG: InlB B-repeat-containing protein [Clostridia bacterium]|nr:InlB B-repeat-containing protein [Clostridia bacterium]